MSVFSLRNNTLIEVTIRSVAEKRVYAILVLIRHLHFTWSTMKAPRFRLSRAPVWIAGLSVTVLVTLVFLLLFWNRFIGLRSGDGGLTGGMIFLNGFVPYRDFYSPGPPLFLLRSAAILSLFGKTLVALRAAGVFERVLLATLLYAWLARFFKAGNAALATIVTIVASASDFSDPLSSYNHFTILMSVAAALASSYALDENRTQRALLAIGSIAGAFAFLSIASKQTIGLAITVCLPIIVGACLIRLDGLRKSVAFIGGFFAAWFAGLALLLAWFVRLGILHIFLRQIFVIGPAAKSSHAADFFTRFIYVYNSMRWETALGLIGFLICCAALYRSGRRDGKLVDATRSSWILVLGALVLGAGAIALSFVVPRQILDNYLLSSPLGTYVDSYRIVRSLIPCVFFGSWLLGVAYFLRFCWKGGLSRRQSQFLLFTAVSFSVAFMLSLSYPAFEAMTIPGLALFLAALLEETQDWRKWLIYTACTALLIFEIQLKVDAPFAFAGWGDLSVASANQTSTLPELKGMRLPRPTLDLVETIVHIIQQNSSPTDTIFIYPELSILYGLSHRMPATISGSHNIDVVPDAFAREEAARLLLHPPAVIVYGAESDRFLIGQERLWRNGLPSGQRAIIAAVRTLGAQYQEVATIIPPGHLGYVHVYVRPKSWNLSTSAPALPR
jgi:small basic protein